MRLAFILLLFSFSVNAQIKTTVITIKKGSKDSLAIFQNTRAAECSYLTPFEKEVIQWLNIARMYPKDFIYYASLKNNNEDYYEQSLYQTLQSMKPMTIKLIPDRLLWQSAKCHAESGGPIGLVSHTRVNKNCKKPYFSECIQFGNKTALGVVKQLLLDRSVPTLGHRISCLNPKWRKVGLKNAAHKKYGQHTVIDFR